MPAISKKLITLLEKSKAKYTILPHRTVFTAYDRSQTLKRSLADMLKIIVVRADSAYWIVALPGNRRVDFKKLKKALGAKKVDIAKESVQKQKFHVAMGAMTPFGVLYKDTGVLFDKALIRQKKLVIGAGVFNQSLDMAVKQLVNVVEPKIVDVSEKAKPIVVKKKKKKVVSKKRG